MPELTTGDGEPFVFDFPLYAVFDRVGGDKIRFQFGTSQVGTFAAVFTDRDLANRAKEMWTADGGLAEIAAADNLLGMVQDFVPQGVTHVCFDPTPDPDRIGGRGGVYFHGRELFEQLF